MAGETLITVVGNMVDDPELRFTPSGAAVANFRIASTPRGDRQPAKTWPPLPKNHSRKSHITCASLPNGCCALATARN